MLEPATLAGDRDAGRVMQQAIQSCGRQHRLLGEGRIALAEGQVAGDDQAASRVARRDHLRLLRDIPSSWLCR
jgi:hypothetical protein